MIKPYRGKFHTEWKTNVTGVVFDVNDLVYLDSNGAVAQFADDASNVPYGLIQEAIAATDTKYSTAGKVPVLVGDADAEFLCDVGTGTGATGDVGEWVDADGTYDWEKIDLDSSTYDVWFVTQFISTTQMVCKMAKKSGAAA